MIRGTTPTIMFKFPFDTGDISKYRMYFLQGNQVLLTKEEGDLHFVDDTVFTKLSQEETLLFNPKKRVEIRTRFVYGEDNSVAGAKSVFLDVTDTGTPNVIE